MKRPFITGLLTIAISVGAPAVLSLGGSSQGTLHAQTDSMIPDIYQGITGSQQDQTYNFDKDFLKKDNIAPPKSGFRDLLATPAMMSPLAEKSLLNGIASAGQRLVAVGWQGHIIYSDNKGKSWTQAKVPVSVDLTAIYFPSPKQGWAVGHDGIVLHTTDGGTTWTKNLDGYGACRILNKYYKDHALNSNHDKATQDKLRADIQFMIEQGPVNPFLDVWFENESTGYIVGAFNLIFKTEDGGKTWEPLFDRTDNPMGYHLYSVRPAGNDLYITGEQGLVMKLDKQTKFFKAIQTPYMGTYFGVLGKPGALLVFGMRGNIFRSANSGASWQKIDVPDKTALLGGIITQDGRILLASQGGNILISKDDGKKFDIVKRDAAHQSPAHAAAIADGNKLVIAGALGIQIENIR